MSQIRKLKEGQNIPKVAGGYKFQLDSQLYDVTDEQLREIDDRISKLDPQHRRFLANWTNAIKAGNSSGNRAENTVTMNMLSGVEGKNIDRLKRKKGSFWESFLPQDSYYAKEAINEALNITAAVLNSSIGTESSNVTKTKRYNRAANFDYDTDASGKSFYSSNPKNKFIEDRFSSYLDWLSDDKWGDSNEWETPLGENEAILRSWYSGLGDRKKAQAAIDAVMAEVRSKPWDDVSEGAKELLAYFNIGNGTSDDNSSSSRSSGSSRNNPPVDANGNIDTSARTDKGEFRTWYGTGNDKNKLFTNSTVGNTKPYLLNADRLPLYGLGDDYLNGLIYQGRIYKPDEVSQNVQLQDIMNRVITANNSARNTEDVWNNVGALIDFTDNPNHYTSYDSKLHYMPYEYRDLRGILGDGNYSLADISNSYDTGGNRLFEIYDFNNNGTSQWGFRAPQYYVSNVGSLLSYIPEEYTFLNRNWNPMNGYSNWKNINGTEYGLVGSFWGADAHDTIPYQIFEDRQGNFWTKLGNGKMQSLDLDLVEWILQGNKPNHKQMLHGTFSGKRREGEGVRVHDATWLVSHKEGGKVQLKPLPAKLQMGSRLSVAPNQSEQVIVSDDTPLAHASNVWETLTPADQKEITAAAIDVAGAITGLIPGGSIAGTILGIGVSTPLYMSAAKERKGHLDAGDWGQATLSTGLDLVSLIPYLGETGKIAKIGKAVTRVAVPLGKAFSALGLFEASSVLAKNPKDWDTNDLLKLSAGIQSVINIGHGAHIKRGESALAHEISTIRGKEKLPEVKYRSEKFKTADGKPIELESAAIERITDETNKTPGKTLREELKSKGVTDEALKDISDDSLLEQFGFVVGKKGVFKGRHTTAAQQPQPTREEYFKNGWLGDVFDPLARREFARREYIDRNLQDANLRSKLNDAVLSSSTSSVATPREVITTTSLSPKNTPAGRAYIQSLARLGQAETSWTARPVVKAQETTTVDRTSGLRADAEAAIARGEGLPNVSEMARDAGKLGLDSINEFAASTNNVNAGVSKAMGSAPSSNDRSVRLGVESVSNKELKQYLIGLHSVDRREGIEFLKNLSDRKRKSLLAALAKSKSQKAQDLIRAFNEDGTLKTNADKVKSDSQQILEKVRQSFEKQGKNQRQRRQGSKLAENLMKLRQSSNPMQTLAEISSTPEDVKIINVIAPYSFRQALNENFRDAGKRLNGPRLDRYVTKTEAARENHGLVFKKGGILKGQNGLKSKILKDDNGNTTGIDLTLGNPDTGKETISSHINLDDASFGFWNDMLSRQIKTGKALSSDELAYEWERFKKNNSVLTQSKRVHMQLDNEFKNPRAIESASYRNTAMDLDTGGGYSKNLPDLTKYLIPGLSLGRFALNSHFQNKYYKQAVDALNAGRVDKLPVQLNTPRADNPTLDRALQQVQLERMAGVKPVTSDLTANNALLNQREGRLWNRERDIIGQRSAFDWDIKNQILNIENQNLANQVETANDNAMRRAAIDSAIKQQAMELTQRRGQSWENLGLEIQNNLKNDRNTMLNYNKSKEASRLQGIYDKNIDSIFGAKARNRYRGLSADEATQYTDFDDFLSKHPDYSDIYRKNVDQIAQWQEYMSNNMQAWMYSNALNYSYPSFLTGRTSISGYKNGGVIKAQRGLSELALRLKHPHQVRKRIDTRPDGSVIGIIEEVDNMGNVTAQEVVLQGPTKTTTSDSPKESNKANQETNAQPTAVGITSPKPDILIASEYTPVKFSTWSNNNLNNKLILPASAISEEYLPELYNKKKDYTDLVNVLEQLTGKYKKGGYLRGSTRYTKEPDEQIWIDNNKATHKAIAKLSDNTIKLLLRALK